MIVRGIGWKTRRLHVARWRRLPSQGYFHSLSAKSMKDCQS
jgi:hypothetical protein